VDTSNYRVDLVGMQDLIDKAAGLEKQIDDRLRDIQKKIADLHVDWRGQAAESHRQASAAWAAGAAEMNTALGELRKALERARSVYQAAGQTNYGMWPQ
jgi:WXG100 family type VII secretion target